MNFIGHNQLTAQLRELVREREINYNPAGLLPSLNIVEWEAATQILSHYHGDFKYVYARGGVGYALFMVIVDDARSYMFRISTDDLPSGWSQNVPSLFN